MWVGPRKKLGALKNTQIWRSKKACKVVPHTRKVSGRERGRLSIDLSPARDPGEKARRIQRWAGLAGLRPERMRQREREE
jgi:hypothetical protein